MASTETDTSGGTSLTASVGTPSSRKSMPLVDISYRVNFEFDGSNDAVTIDLETGVATGDVTGINAFGTITFSGLPVANDTITVRGVTYTFKASAATATEITIGANATATATNTASKLNANDSLITAISAAGVVTVSAANTGEYGNAYTLAKSATNTAVSGANFTGGVDKVVITNDGVDYLGAALATATKIHGILVTTTAGSVSSVVGTILKGPSTGTTGGFQYFDSAGRADLIDDLVITSTAANTAGVAYILASE